MFKKVFVLLLFTSWCLPGKAANYVFDYDSNCREAYQAYMSMNFAQGDAAILEAIKANPYNLMVPYISDYEDCMLLLFNRNNKDYDQLHSHFEDRLALIEKGDENSPWYRLCKAGLYLHWALIYERFGENIKAAATFRKSYLLIKENQEKFPDFEYNKVFLGFGETATDAIPAPYKGLAAMLGLKSDVNKGMSNLAGFINTHGNTDLLQNEATIFYTYLDFYLLYRQQEAWKFLNSPQFPTQNNLLNLFVKANIAANYRKADVAIQTLQEAMACKAYNSFPILEYEMGCALLTKLDMSCYNHFRRFLEHDNGNLYVKDAWQRMALAWYISGNIQQANYCKSQVLLHGNTQTDADKQAERFANSGAWPNLTLLEGRLLIDGGYYDQALLKLKSINEESLKSISDKLEYYFRFGRVYDELRDTNKALWFYQYTIDIGKDRQDYFAARAALQMGFLYERAGDKPHAIARYKECLGMKGHDFQNSIDQQARSGLKRLSQ